MISAMVYALMVISLGGTVLLMVVWLFHDAPARKPEIRIEWDERGRFRGMRK